MTNAHSRLHAPAVVVANRTLAHQLYHMRTLATDPRSPADLRGAATLATLQRELAASGSGLLLTNTADAVRPKLALLGLASRVSALNASAARLTRAFAIEQSHMLIGGQIAALPGHPTADSARRDYAEQIVGLVAGGVDLLWLEQFSDAVALAPALAACAACAPQLPIVVNFWLPAWASAATLRALSGDAALAATHSQVVALGIDGDQGNLALVAALRQLQTATRGQALAVTLRPENGVPLPLATHLSTRAAYGAIRSGARILAAPPDVTPAFLRTLARAADAVRPAAAQSTTIAPLPAHALLF